METNTQSPEQASHEQLYNIFMLDIEPDLTTDMLPLLEDVYNWQTPEEKEVRLSWYREALEICTNRLASFVDVWSTEVDNVKKVIKEFTHGTEAKQNTAELHEIEDSLDAQ